MTPGRTFSEALKNLYPDKVVVGMSMEDRTLRGQNHPFDFTLPVDLGWVENITAILQQTGFLPPLTTSK